MTVAVAGCHRRSSVAAAATAAHFSRAAVSPGWPERGGEGCYLEVENKDCVLGIPEIMKPVLRERGHGAEVLVDVEHGGIQQGVNVLQALQPGL